MSSEGLGAQAEESCMVDLADIQLNVKGMKNLEAAFKDYIAEETLEGENRYQAEGYGLQDARKGVIFQSFPPVLHLQLKRFEYDFMRDVNVKINDRYEFPLEIDLQPYLDQDALDLNENWNYKLHGVLVHSGDVHGGHYFVLIKPEPDGKWFKLDDDRVIPVLEKEVLEDNFGGEGRGLNGVPHPPVTKQQAKVANKRINNAYMLVYIREHRLTEILQPIGEDETPTHLRTRLEKEKKDAEQKRREREEQHLYLTAKVITDDTFRKHQGFDLASFDDRSGPASQVISMRVAKNRPYVEFKTEICNQYKLNTEDVRLWVLVNRQNKTVRPDAVVPEEDRTLSRLSNPHRQRRSADQLPSAMESVRDKMASRQQDLKLYLEFFPEDDKKRWAADYPEEAPIMIFVKQFDVSTQTLAGVGHFYIHKHMRVQDLVPQICERTAVPVGTPLKIFEVRTRSR